MKDHNPGLAHGLLGGDVKGTEAGIERPDAVENIPWQTRAAAPTEAENAFADALQSAFADEVYDLPGIVERLSRLGVRTQGGAAWTEDSLRAELRRLGS